MVCSGVPHSAGAPPPALTLLPPTPTPSPTLTLAPPTPTLLSPPAPKELLAPPVPSRLLDWAAEPPCALSFPTITSLPHAALPTEATKSVETIRQLWRMT